MPIKLIPLTCPSCGAQLEMPADAQDFYCSHCGTHLYADDGSATLNINQTVTIRDEAALRRIEIEERREEERRERERERQERKKPADPAAQRKRWLRLLVGYPVSFALVFVGTAALSGIISGVFGADTEALDGVLTKIVVLYLVVGLPAWVVLLFVKRPKKGRTRPRS